MRCLDYKELELLARDAETRAARAMSEGGVEDDELLHGELDARLAALLWDLRHKRWDETLRSNPAVLVPTVETEHEDPNA